MKAIGHTLWTIPGGHIPPRSTGDEPAFTSRDEIILLNTGDDLATVEITVFHADREPIGPYRLTVAPRRVRRVRCNDLIDPEAIPLGLDFAMVLASDTPIVVQFDRVDTSQAALARQSVLAFPLEG